MKKFTIIYVFLILISGAFAQRSSTIHFSDQSIINNSEKGYESNEFELGFQPKGSSFIPSIGIGYIDTDPHYYDSGDISANNYSFISANMEYRYDLFNNKSIRFKPFIGAKSTMHFLYNSTVPNMNFGNKNTLIAVGTNFGFDLFISKRFAFNLGISPQYEFNTGFQNKFYVGLRFGDSYQAVSKKLKLEENEMAKKSRFIFVKNSKKFRDAIENASKYNDYPYEGVYYTAEGFEERSADITNFASKNNIRILKLYEGSPTYLYGQEYTPIIKIDYKLESDYLAELKQKEEAESQRKIEEENKRREEQDYRRAELTGYENTYNASIENAKKSVNNTDKSVIVFSNGYYVGETKDGKRNGYGEFYWKNTTTPIKEVQNRNISYKGYWLHDTFNGKGILEYQRRETLIGMLVWGVTDLVTYKEEGNYIDGQINGKGYFTKNSKTDFVLYENGKISRNYSEEARDRELERWRANKKIEECKNCVVDVEKTTIPTEEEVGLFLTYTRQNPGKIIMKNEETYNYWYDQNNKNPWRIVDKNGILFDDYISFETFDEMLDALIEKCIQVKCKK